MLFFLFLTSIFFSSISFSFSSIEKMKRGEVVSFGNSSEFMNIKILEHEDPSEIGKTYFVTNDKNKFKLLERADEMKDERKEIIREEDMHLLKRNKYFLGKYQLKKLAKFIKDNCPGEPSKSESAVNCAIKLLTGYKNQLITNRKRQEKREEKLKKQYYEMGQDHVKTHKTDNLLERMRDLLIEVEDDPVANYLPENKERYLFKLAALRAGIKELIKEFSSDSVPLLEDGLNKISAFVRENYDLD